MSGLTAVEAADGNILRTVDAANYSCGVGTGVAFDGTNLLLTCWGSNVITAVRPADGSFVRTYTIAGVSDLGAMAYDVERQKVWACQGSTQVYLIDLASETSQAMFGTLGCVDGLAYDGVDDVIYTSGDVASTFERYTTGGIRFAQDSVSGKLGACGSSGLAIGGPYLFLANNGCSQVYRAPKANLSDIQLFGTYSARLEDMECDDITFSADGKAAIWTKDAYDGELNALELNPGDCGFGGQPPSSTTEVKVLALGDSYSAGVGGSGDPASQDCWQRPSASFSGQAVAAAQQANMNIEYDNKACIGATTMDILSRGQPGTSRSKQLDYVASFQPDIVTLTIGGNDVGFGPIATDCVINSIVFFWQCNVDADRVNLVDKAPEERRSYDGLYDRLVATYVAVREAQGPDGSLYVLSYPTVFEKFERWDTSYLIALRAGLIPTAGNCFGFGKAQARESNMLSTRLGDTIFQAVQTANSQVGNVHFVDWRNDVVTESDGFFGLKQARTAYNGEGLCARNAPWDLNGYATGGGKQFGKDTFHPTEQGYEFAADRLRAALGW